MLSSDAAQRGQRLVGPVLLVSVLALVFLSVGRWGPDANPDTAAAAIPAWSLVMRGQLDLAGYEGPLPWVVEVEGRVYSDRPPGLIGLAIPAYLIARPAEFTNAPATATAAILTMLAVLVAWQTIRMVTTGSFAAYAALIYAFGTTTWIISSAQLWPHGPGQLLLGMAVLSLAHGSQVWSGVFFGLEILVRPLTALAAALTGILESARGRSLAPAIRIGGPATIGLAVLLAYNRYVFGSWSITGGYPTTFSTGALERFSPTSYLQNVANMFILPPNALLLWSPIVAVGILGAWRHRDQVPGWARSAAWSGLAYLLVHSALNRASGGLPLFYRYPLEAIALAAPALSVGAFHLIREGGISAGLVRVSAALSVALQVIGGAIVTCARFSADAPICVLAG